MSPLDRSPYRLAEPPYAFGVGSHECQLRARLRSQRTAYHAVQRHAVRGQTRAKNWIYQSSDCLTGTI